MATLTERLELLITASAKGAVAGLKETEVAAGSLDAKAQGLGGSLKSMGLTGNAAGALMAAGIVGGAVAAGAAIGKFVLDGVDKFVSLTGEVRSLQRIMGGTAEDVSRLAFAFRILGIDSEAAGKGMFQLAKRIGEGKDTLAQWGVEVAKNRDGTVNMAETVANMAERYQSLGDATQRDAFLFENFGRQGATLIPLLSRSRSEIEAIYAEAAKDHQIFSQADLQAGRDYEESMRKLHQAVTGLEIEIARGLVPAITAIAGAATVAIHGLDALGNELEEVDKKAGGLGIVTGLFQNFFQVTGYMAGQIARGPGGTWGEWWTDQSSKATVASDRLTEAQNRLIAVRADPNASAEQIARAEEHYAAASQNAAAAGVTNAQGLYDSATAAQLLKDQEILLNGTLDQQIALLDRGNAALLDKYSKQFAAMHADESARDAIDKLNKTNADAKASEDDRARAVTAAEEAAIRSAVAAGAYAEELHKGEGAAKAHEAGTKAQIEQLNRLMEGLAPDSPLRAFLAQYVWDLVHVPPAVHTEATFNYSTAHDAVASWASILRTEIPGVVGSVGSFITRQHGGPIPGGVNTPMPILAHGGEYVLSADVVERIKAGRTSWGAQVKGGDTYETSPAGGGAAAGGGPIVVNLHLDGQIVGQTVIDVINRKATRGPGPLLASAVA